jgi:hypothetical protein
LAKATAVASPHPQGAINRPLRTQHRFARRLWAGYQQYPEGRRAFPKKSLTALADRGKLARHLAH